MAALLLSRPSHLLAVAVALCLTCVPQEWHVRGASDAGTVTGDDQINCGAHTITLLARRPPCVRAVRGRLRAVCLRGQSTREGSGGLGGRRWRKVPCRLRRFGHGRFGGWRGTLNQGASARALCALCVGVRARVRARAGACKGLFDELDYEISKGARRGAAQPRFLVAARSLCAPLQSTPRAFSLFLGGFFMPPSPVLTLSAVPDYMKIDTGSQRMDPQGKMAQNKKSYARSEVHLYEVRGRGFAVHTAAGRGEGGRAGLSSNQFCQSPIAPYFRCCPMLKCVQC